MEPALLLAYLGLPCAWTCSDPQQKLCLKRRTFICSFAGDVELWMGNVVSIRLHSRSTCEQNHSNHVLTFFPTDPFWVSRLPPFFAPGYILVTLVDKCFLILKPSFGKGKRNIKKGEIRDNMLLVDASKLPVSLQLHTNPRSASSFGWRQMAGSAEQCIPVTRHLVTHPVAWRRLEDDAIQLLPVSTQLLESQL